MKKKLINLIAQTIGVQIGALLIYLVTKSVRKKFINPEYGFEENGKLKKCIIALWHNRLFLLTGVLAGQSVSPIISKSKDGELIAKIAGLLGYKCIRGSTSRGGREALMQMVKNKFSTNSFGFTVDGPRGPIYEPKQGAIFLASKTGLPIIPFSYTVSKKIEFNSWDRFIIPVPFAKANICFGKPMYVKKDISKDQMKEYQDALKQSLLDLDRHSIIW